MNTPAVDQQNTSTTAVTVGAELDPFDLDITFIEGTPAAETVLMCTTGDNCGSSCPSACTTS